MCTRRLAGSGPGLDGHGLSPGFDVTWQVAAYTRLVAVVQPLGSVVVALSGGVDSALVLEACVHALGKDHVLAATLVAPYIPGVEFAAAKDTARQCGARHFKVKAHLGLLRDNPLGRCYLCKRNLFERLRTLARAKGLARVVEGSNRDDACKDRPGLIAIRELGIGSPLQDAGLTKVQVRELAQWRGLSVWNKPAQTCLLTRFAHGTVVSSALLRQVVAAEKIMHGLGFDQVRVRHQGQVARVEVAPERVLELTRIQEKVKALLEKLGFSDMLVVREGYRS